MYSVLIPLYKGSSSEGLNTCLKSILNDISIGIKVYVSCDGMLTQKQYFILESFCNKNNNLIILNADSTSKPNGITQALNFGLENIKSRYISRMDADDIWPSGRHDVITKWIESNNDCNFLSGDILEIGHKKNAIRKGHDIKRWKLIYFFRNPLNHVSITFDRESVLRIGGYKNIPGAEDWELWARAHQNGLNFKYIDYVFAHVDVSSLSSRRFGIKSGLDEIKIIKSLIVARNINDWRIIPIMLFLIIRIFLRFIPKSLGARLYFMLRKK